ncbi:GNAT family N-acetyltransferase [Pseudenhygromyxa sp. WMMC2535]|uniref:GNAT family N-acetyltransferase n=1 Tax=Pseudenhygromyxa sp. WMMC2535 TaxID=2712867 RepID=UPI0015950902|nr:GNAT family N-acetyltransferase [Pseudenhygromyxa sp. WMMC2535]NVB42340.1 GNAT family N-acetyltransferase [Pseudenhygromyxa sp. WMMC2535]
MVADLLSKSCYWMGMEEKVEIVLLRECMELFDEVVVLGDRFRQKLGLFPREALREKALAGELFVACESEKLVGYLLFRVSRRHPRRATIIHLCVEPSCRGRGIARALVGELVARTRDLDGIRLSCRRDYEENRLWPRLGFRLLEEKPGRGKDGARLNIWWLGQGSPLLSRAAELIGDVSVVVAMDAMVVFDLDDENEAGTESRALQSDWLREQLWLVVTPELNTEIDRREELQARERSRALAQRFSVLEADRTRFDDARTRLLEVLGQPRDENERSDLRELAWAAAGAAEHFVTRDERLLGLSLEIADAVELSVLRPSALIVALDELARESAYQPRRFEGSRLLVRSVQPKEEGRLVEHYLDFSSGERRAGLCQRLREAFGSEPGSVREVSKEEESLVLYRFVEEEDSLKVPLLRTGRGSLAKTVLRHLLSSVVAGGEGRSIVVTDHASQEVEGALLDTGFLRLDGVWVKPILRYVGPGEGIRPLLAKLPHGAEILARAAEIFDEGRPHALLEFERKLSPAKFEDLDEVPHWILPIQPHWAAQLFDTRLAEQDLFGLPPELGFRLENVYYRSARGSFEAPARVLWYVSRGKGSSYVDTGAIRAMSYLDEVVVGTPKQLFSRFRRLGIYRWKDVLGAAGGGLEGRLMALRFSGTELLPKAIPLREVRARMGKDWTFQGPVRITRDQFFDLYLPTTSP